MRCALPLMLATCGLAACASATVRGTGYCAPRSSAQAFTADAPPPHGAPREEHMAALLGLHAMFEDGVSDESARIHVLERVTEARLTIDATSAELDCEVERARHVSDYLANRRSSAVQSLTIGSIAAAAATGVVGVFLSTENTSAWTQNGFAIGGGAVTSGLGLASLFVQPSIRFEHPRNLLADVWNGPIRSSTYPPLVWDYLNRPDFSNDQRTPIRDKIVERWRHFEGVENGTAAASLLFGGSGGLYNADTLQLRAAMFESVKAEVELENQDLAVLVARLRASP